MREPPPAGWTYFLVRDQKKTSLICVVCRDPEPEDVQGGQKAGNCSTVNSSESSTGFCVTTNFKLFPADWK